MPRGDPPGPSRPNLSYLAYNKETNGILDSKYENLSPRNKSKVMEYAQPHTRAEHEKTESQTTRDKTFEALHKWANNITKTYTGRNGTEIGAEITEPAVVHISEDLGKFVVTVFLFPGKIQIFEWTMDNTRIELEDFMFDITSEDACSEIAERARSLFQVPDRSLLGIVSEMTAFLARAGKDEPRQFTVNDSWYSRQGELEMNSSDIKGVAEKYIGHKKYTFSPREALIFESCERKIKRMLKAAEANGVWGDLAEHGYYGLMWDKDNKIRTIKDVCC